MKRRLANSRLLRKILFPLLRKIDVSVKIKHDYTGRDFNILSWSHKGYWFYGREREANELAMFEELIQEGDVVFEVGGHVGYLTQVFEDLVGAQGTVIVAEPAPSNLNFLRSNILGGTTVVPCAISDEQGDAVFYTDRFGGFTNSLMRDFTEERSADLSQTQSMPNKKVQATSVRVRTLDSVIEDLGVSPTFLKIDVEGAELSVLLGGRLALEGVRALMIEISRNRQEIFELLRSYKFELLEAKHPEIPEAPGTDNYFFVKVLD